MGSSGANVRPLERDDYDESEPAWSPSGSRLLISIASCSFTYFCSTYEGIRVARPDGSDPITIITGSAFNPAWRR
jgi:hypothetical protein